MSEVLVAEKAGMLVGGDKENGFNVIGWVLAGDEYDCDTEAGETLVTHHKTAEKLGLGDVFKEMKAENAPAKAKKEASGDGEKKEASGDGEKKARGPRKPLPKEGTYTIHKPELLKGDPCERTDLCELMASNTDFADFWAAAPKTFKHTTRKGEEVELSTSGFVGYAIKRGIITVDA